MKRKIRAKLPYPMNVQDPDQLFDLICVKNYMAGQFDRNLPVDESRKEFQEVLRLKEYYKPNPTQ
jgi:5-formaminoimidazole-4-carboxamide-1-beta-D-ribofuranosyl 5'-monophosphate synthetase